jgi:hypothetical protein
MEWPPSNHPTWNPPPDAAGSVACSLWAAEAIGWWCPCALGASLWHQHIHVRKQGSSSRGNNSCAFSETMLRSLYVSLHVMTELQGKIRRTSNLYKLLWGTARWTDMQSSVWCIHLRQTYHLHDNFSLAVWLHTKASNRGLKKKIN